MTQIFYLSDFTKDKYYYAIENATQFIIPLGTCTSTSKTSDMVKFCWHDGPTYKINYQIEFDSHMKTELHKKLADINTFSYTQNELACCWDIIHNYSFFSNSGEPKVASPLRSEDLPT